MVRDPSIVSPSLTGVVIGGGHNKHGTGSRCTLLKVKQYRPPSPRRRWRCDRSSYKRSLFSRKGFPTTCSSLVTSPASSPLFLSGMESVSAGSVQAITGVILSYSSSASAPNLDPIAFKEAAREPREPAPLRRPLFLAGHRRDDATTDRPPHLKILFSLKILFLCQCAPVPCLVSCERRARYSFPVRTCVEPVCCEREFFCLNSFPGVIPPRQVRTPFARHDYALTTTRRLAAGFCVIYAPFLRPRNRRARQRDRALIAGLSRRLRIRFGFGSAIQYQRQSQQWRWRRRQRPAGGPAVA